MYNTYKYYNQNTILKNHFLDVLTDYILYWQQKTYFQHCDIESFKLENMELALLTTYDNDFILYSALEDISEYVPNTLRILSHNVTTYHNNKSFFLKVGNSKVPGFPMYAHATLQVYYAMHKYPTKNIVITCNTETGNYHSYRMGLLMNKAGPNLLYDWKKTQEISIYNVNQYMYHIDPNYILSLAPKIYQPNIFSELCEDIINE